jgi:DNA repair protein RecN (Recombination protein N)
MILPCFKQPDGVMLLTLSIKNFALVEELKVSLKAGLNVLTGETGAGKSILIDALSVLLGAKASPSLIRAGADKAQIEGVFHLTPQVAAWLKEQELLDSETELVVAREISKTASRFRINGTLVNQALTQELRQILISLHAQHEARTLLSSQAQLEMLDALADKAHHKLVDNVRTLYLQQKDLDAQLRDLEISEEERLRRLDFVKFQLSELQESKLLKEDEDDLLAEQACILANAVALGAQAQNAQQLLIGGEAEAVTDGDSRAAIDSIQEALSEVERGSKLDPHLKPMALLLQNSLASIEEAATALRKYRDGLETNPEELQLIESRIAQLATIKRKYGPTIREAMERCRSLESDLNNLETAQTRSEELTEQRDAAAQELAALAGQLSQQRSSLAKELAKRVEADLKDLGMERCRFEVSIESQKEIGPSGADRVEFVIAPNPGQPPMSLAKIASGGELSRIMLVIKSIFAKADRVATVVFDEIDTGLSGRVLQSMRDKLKELAESHQILCITHQPIIAAIADNHLQIQKQLRAKSTEVSLRVLEGDERLKALAEMASGEENGEVAINFARSLISQAKQAP